MAFADSESPKLIIKLWAVLPVEIQNEVLELYLRENHKNLVSKLGVIDDIICDFFAEHDDVETRAERHLHSEDRYECLAKQFRTAPDIGMDWTLVVQEIRNRLFGITTKNKDYQSGRGGSGPKLSQRKLVGQGEYNVDAETEEVMPAVYRREPYLKIINRLPSIIDRLEASYTLSPTGRAISSMLLGGERGTESVDELLEMFGEVRRFGGLMPMQQGKEDSEGVQVAYSERGFGAFRRYSVGDVPFIVAERKLRIFEILGKVRDEVKEVLRDNVVSHQTKPSSKLEKLAIARFLRGMVGYRGEGICGKGLKQNELYPLEKWRFVANLVKTYSVFEEFVDAHCGRFGFHSYGFRLLERGSISYCELNSIERMLLLTISHNTWKEPHEQFDVDIKSEGSRNRWMGFGLTELFMDQVQNHVDRVA